MEPELSWSQGNLKALELELSRSQEIWKNFEPCSKWRYSESADSKCIPENLAAAGFFFFNPKRYLKYKLEEKSLGKKFIRPGELDTDNEDEGQADG